MIVCRVWYGDIKSGQSPDLMPLANTQWGRLVPALGILQVPEKLRIWLDQQHIASALERILVGAQAACKRVELRVLIERLGVDSRCLGVTVTANLLGFAVGVGRNHRHLTVSSSPDTFCKLLTLGAASFCLYLYEIIYYLS